MQWIEMGKEQKSVSGRDRINMNGSINPEDVTDLQMVEKDMINAEFTKELFQKLINKNPEATKIYVICDNSRYYHNKILQKWVKETKISMIFLPPYSPNLNLIERLWKFMRKVVINTAFYRTKEEFRKAVLAFFKDIRKYKTSLETLLTMNFHIFEKNV